MAKTPGFPPPLSKLGDSGVGVAAAPSGGMGLALTPEGKIPAGVLFLGANAYRVALGSATFHWTAAGQQSDVLTIAHGLGVVPVWHAVYVQALVGGAMFAFDTAAVDATNITCAAYCPVAAIGAGTNRTAFWAVIG